jgi:transcriptional regulator with XRE-family HTH domain
MSAYFAEMLKAFRKGKKLTQADLAEKLGKATSQIGQYEQNRCDPPYAVLEKLIFMFDMQPEMLFKAKPKATEDKYSATLKRIIAKMDEQQKRILAEHLCSMQGKTVEEFIAEELVEEDEG